MDAKITTQEVSERLGIDLTTLRRLMRKGTIKAPPILFDPNSTGRMWSKDDVVQQARAALQSNRIKS